MDYYHSNKNEHVIVKQEKVNTPDVDKYELNQFILKQGDFNVEEIMINEKKCFAYLKFKTKEEAAKALKALHLKDFKNYIIKDEPFKSNKNKDKQKLNTNLFVKNLPKDCTPKKFLKFFQNMVQLIQLN